MSIAGLIKLHTDAAIITPAAKPKSAFWNKVLICFFMKNARADPNVVPARGTVSATTTPSIMVFTALRSSLCSDNGQLQLSLFFVDSICTKQNRC